MALLAVPDRRKEARVVEAPPSPDSRLAAAQKAEVRPRSRVAELQAAFDEALAAKRYGEETERLQAELHEARVALTEAEAYTRGIREGLAAADRQRAAERKRIEDAQREAEGRRIIEDAMAADKRAVDGIEEALAEMRACLNAARAAFAKAQNWQAKTGQERQRINQARIMLGETQPGGRISGANKATAIGDRDPLVRELLRWDGQAWRA